MMRQKCPTSLDSFLKGRNGVDWQFLDSIAGWAEPALSALSLDESLVSAALDNLLEDESLHGFCEHYDLLDKLVLYVDPKTDLRLRMHLFLDGYFDRPHNHRWSYSSRILLGRYRHVLYTTQEQLSETIDVTKLNPVLIREESAGSSYTLSHEVIHSVTASPNTLSLVIRGPSVSSKFLVTDRVTGTAWWQYGAAGETAGDRSSKIMTLEYLRETVARIKALLQL